MLRKSIVVCTVLAIIGSNFISAEPVAIDPGLYLSIAKASTDIIRVINRYHDLLSVVDPVLLMEAEGYFPLRSFDMPTALGGRPLGGYPDQLDAIVFWKFLDLHDLNLDLGGMKIDDFKARIFFLASVFGFMLDDASINYYSALKDNDIRTGWTNGYGLVACELTFGSDVSMTIGGNIRYTPYITGSAGSELFDVNPFTDEGEGIFPTHTFAFDSLYLDAKLYGYTLNTFVSLSAIEQLAFEKLFDVVEDIFKIGPSVYWFNAISSLQPGVSGRLTLFGRFDFSAGVYAGFDASDFSPSFSNAFLDTAIPIIALDNVEHPERAFDLTLFLRTSVAYDYYGDFVLGGSAEVQLNNLRIWTFWDLFSMQSYLTIIAGITYNYYEALARLPLPDEPVLYAKLRLLLY
jgi:hypothetical protein